MCRLPEAAVSPFFCQLFTFILRDILDDMDLGLEALQNTSVDTCCLRSCTPMSDLVGALMAGTGATEAAECCSQHHHACPSGSFRR